MPGSIGVGKSRSTPVANAAHPHHNPPVSPESLVPPPSTRSPRGLGTFRLYAALTFAFAWVPVMFTAFTIDRGFSPTDYARFWSAYYFAMVIAEIPWGRVADRFGERPLLIAGPLWLAACFALLGRSESVGVVMFAMAATGAGHAMISGTDSAYLFELLKRDGRVVEILHEEAVAHRWRLFGVSIADMLGGLVAFAAGTVAAFDLSVVIMLVAAYTACRLPVSPRARDDVTRPSLAGLGRALRHPGVFWVLAWYAAVFVLLRIGFQLYQPTLIALGADNLIVHGATLSLLNLIAGFSALTVRGTHRRFGERGTTTMVLILMGLSFLGLSFLDASTALLVALGVGAALFCFQQVSFGFLQPIGRTALNMRIPSGDRVTMLSAQSLIARLAFGLVLITGDWDAAFTSDLQSTYLALAVAAVVIAACLHMTHRDRSLNPL